MRPGAFLFAGKWMKTVQQLREIGMGYTVVRLTLADGRKFDQVLIESGHLARVRGIPSVPFTEDDIVEIKETGERWDWSETP